MMFKKEPNTDTFPIHPIVYLLQDAFTRNRPRQRAALDQLQGTASEWPGLCAPWVAK